MPEARKPCISTRTTCARWNTACRPPRDWAWAWIGWSCCTRIRPRFGMCCCSLTCGPSFELSGEASIPIGVFDSGVGGLTVLHALRLAMPAQDFIYLGDTARLPYGTKSAETVVRYSLQCAAALIRRRVRCLVVACNTASASALDALRAQHPDLPVIGVIEPGAAAAVAASESQHIAVIATEGTIAGGAYPKAIQRLNPGARVTSRA